MYVGRQHRTGAHNTRRREPTVDVTYRRPRCDTEWLTCEQGRSAPGTAGWPGRTWAQAASGRARTAGPQSPVQFAGATMARRGLASTRTLDAYEALFDRGDQAAFPVLMEGHRSG